MSTPLHVIIVGAGLAGPALAIALAKHSIKTTVLERRSHAQDIGGVIMLAPNAMRVMDSLLGVNDRLRASGDSFDAINIYMKGADLYKIGGFEVKDQGIRAVSIARPVLHKELLMKMEETGLSDMRYGAEVDKIEEDDQGCEVTLKSGEVVRGSIIIGADGIRSAVREHILGPSNVPPQYAGYLSIGSIMPRSKANLPADMALPAFLYTQSGTFLVFAMDGSEDRIQWATTVTTPERTQRHGWEELRESGAAVAMVKDTYRDVTAEPIKSFVDSLTNTDVRLWAPYQLPSIPTWHSNRVCLVGDAAHAITPAVGQGAAQSFEDIGLLARLLTSPAAVERGFPALFAHYESKRKPRMTQIQKMSARAEQGRGQTNWFMWQARSWGMWAALKAFGKNGYVKGGPVVYDVNKEDIDVK